MSWHLNCLTITTQQPKGFWCQIDCRMQSSKGNKMKKFVLLTALGLIATTQSFSQVRGGFGGTVEPRNQGGWDEASDNYNSVNTWDRRSVREQRIQIPLNDHLRGQNKIKLKQEIKLLNPYLDLRQSEIVGVILVAKSKQGRGKANLIIGGHISSTSIIGGYPEDFHYNENYTYSKVKIENSSLSSQGKWQLDLQGNIKVKKVVVILKEKQIHEQQRVVKIDMYDQHLRGLNTLKIKQLLKQQNHRLDLSKFSIKDVTLIAKSKKGNGEAVLIVDGRQGYPQTIRGGVREFDSNAPRTYSQIRLVNGNSIGGGRVQVELKGNIKVKEIMVKLKKLGQRGGRIDLPTNPRRRTGTRAMN